MFGEYSLPPNSAVKRPSRPSWRRHWSRVSGDRIGTAAQSTPFSITATLSAGTAYSEMKVSRSKSVHTARAALSAMISASIARISGMISADFSSTTFF